MFKKIIFYAIAILPFYAQAQPSLAQRIDAKASISIGTEGVYPPFSYHDESGKLTGYDVEVARAVGKELGITIKFEETVWDSMMAGLKAKRFDLVANQVALSTPERREMFILSEPYSWSGQMILARKGDERIKNLSDIKGLKAAQVLTSNHTHTAKAAGAEIVAVESLSQGLMLLEQGRAEIALNDALGLLDYLKKFPNSTLVPVWRAPKADWLGSGFVANKGDEEAIEKINSALETLRANGTLKALGEQFFGEDVSVR